MSATLFTAPIEDNPLSAGLLQASSAPINIPSSPISNSISGRFVY